MLQFRWYTSAFVYAGDANIPGGCVLTIKKNTDTLVVVSKETGLVGNADKTNSMVISFEIRMQVAFAV
jgi:hypothetical protein